jgi:hypothetical protein
MDGSDEHELLREQKRQAQIRYRRLHAERLTQVGQVRNILTRQKTYHGDIEELSGLLQTLGPTVANGALRTLAGPAACPVQSLMTTHSGH